MWDYPTEILLVKKEFPPCTKETEMSTTQIVPHGQDTAIQGELYMSFELGQVVEADGQRWPTRPEPLQRARRRHGCGARLRAPGQGARPARAASQGAFRLGGRPRWLVAAPAVKRA